MSVAAKLGASFAGLGDQACADESRRNGGQVGGRRWKEWNSGSGVIRLERGDANRR